MTWASDCLILTLLYCPDPINLVVTLSEALNEIPLMARLRLTAAFTCSALLAAWVLVPPVGTESKGSVFRVVVLACLMASVYFLAESTAVTFRFGRVSHSVTIAEMLLVAGALLLPPAVHVAVRALAQGAGSYARLSPSKRKGLPWLVLINFAQGALEVTVFCSVITRLGFSSALADRDLLVLGAGFVMVLLISPAVWTVFQSNVGARLPLWKVVKTDYRLYELSFVLFSISVLVFAILASNVVGGLLFIVLMVALAHPLRQYAKLSTRAEESANLFHFSDLLSQSRDATEFSRILDHAAQTARGGESEVVLLNVRNLAPGSALVVRGDARTPLPLKDLPSEWLEIMTETKSRQMSVDKPWRDAKTAMAAPLLANGVAIGLLVVSSHSDEFHNFSTADVVILETLARHLALWLEQDRLMDALEIEIEERVHDALRDPVTDLANRTAFTNALTMHMEQKTETSVLLINLTHFKVVNEHYGHDAGDILLAEIGQRIKRIVPGDLLVARLGGDEFTVTLPNVSISDAQAIASNLIRGFRKPYRVGTDEVEIGAAIGIVQYPTHGLEVTALMRSADNAMYQAKSLTEGVYSPQQTNQTIGANTLARTVELRRAIEGFRIIPHFQPVIDIRTGIVTAFEALARWQTSPGVFARPDEFIALAEETHLIHELTVQIASHALTNLANWRTFPGNAELTVSVNISPVSLGRTDVTEQLLSLLRDLNLPASALTLEITESRVMEDPERSIRHLKDLANEGLKLAIDDFGAGQTSLSYLADLPVHHLKIDRSFLLEALEKPTARRLLATMIALGKDLNQKVTVEGVETSEHWQMVRELGVDKVQGWFVAKAMPAAVASDWLRNDVHMLLESLGVGQTMSYSARHS